jgi:hypothetical protein
MESWHCSDILHACMEVLAKCELLRARTEANEWIVPGINEVSMPPDGYVASFVPFHERGLAIPPLFLLGTTAPLWHRAVAPEP